MKVDKDDFSFMTVYVWSMEVVVSFSFTTDVCVQITFQQDKPKFNTFEYAIWELGGYKHIVSSSVFSVCSYILVLRLR